MIAAIIVAGGSGLRMRAAVRKQYLELDGRPVLAHTLAAMDRFNALDRIVLVVPADDLERCRRQIVDGTCLDHAVDLVAGGRRRQDSVVNGLDALGAGDGIVMIHDGVRPFVDQRLFDALIAGVNATGACIPALPATDTLKQVTDDGLVTATLDRRSVYCAQTPQVFSIKLIRDAHRHAERCGFSATDDASVAEFAGHTVSVIPGNRENIKITTPLDMHIARAILASLSASGEV